MTYYSPSETLKALEDKYADKMTERERALLEAEIWKNVPHEVRKKTRRYGAVGYISERFLVSCRAVEARQMLLRVGHAADPLWERIEAGMAHYTAVNLLRRVRGRDPIDLASAMKEELEYYDSIGHEVQMPDGRVFRRSFPTTPPKAEESPPSPVSEPEIVPSVNPELASRAFWAAIRASIIEHSRAKMEDVDPMVQESVMRVVEADMNILFEDIQNRVRNAHRSPSLNIVTVNRKALREACLTLSMDPPASGKPVDLKLANSQKKKHARAYHPDLNGNSEESVARFTEVINAYATLESYNESLAPDSRSKAS